MAHVQPDQQLTEFSNLGLGKRDHYLYGRIVRNLALLAVSLLAETSSQRIDRLNLILIRQQKVSLN